MSRISRLSLISFSMVFSTFSLSLALPSAESPVAGMTSQGSGGQWKTSVLIKSSKPFWFIKSAKISDRVNRRRCAEDTSPGRKASKAILGDIEMVYPNPRRGNGDFDVIVNAANLTGVTLSKCTYNANITFYHGKKGYKVRSRFVLNMGSVPPPPKKVEPPKPIAKPITPPPPPVVKKPDPPKKDPKPVEVVKADPPKPDVKKVPPPPPSNKIFQAEDMKAPDKVVVSEESKLALAQTKKVEEKAPPPKAVSSNSPLTEGMKAYRGGDFDKAAKDFLSVPKPKSKRKGSPGRDDYLKANLYRGLAAQQLGSLKVAVRSYQEVLAYEKHYPQVNLNMGICYMELRQFLRAHRAFNAVIRDQNRIPPEQFDDVMQRTRYFWALTWTRMYRLSKNPDRKSYYQRTAKSKWTEYNQWFGDLAQYSKDNTQANNYLNTLE